MIYLHFHSVDDTDVYTEQEPLVHESVSKVTDTHECVVLKVLAMLTRTGAAVVVAPTQHICIWRWAKGILTKPRVLLGSAVHMDIFSMLPGEAPRIIPHGYELLISSQPAFLGLSQTRTC